MTAPLVHPAGPADLDLLAALHGACFTEAWDAAGIAALLAVPGTRALIAAEAAIPLGFVLYRSAADEAEILAIGVLPAARRRGFGRRLLAAAEDTLRDMDIRRLFLEVAEDDPAARALYRAAGFVELGRRTGYYRRTGAPARDALVMGKPVAPPVAVSPSSPISTDTGKDMRHLDRDGWKGERSVRTEVELTVKIISAYVSHAQLPVEALEETIEGIHETLRGLGRPAVRAEPTRVPAVPISASIQPDYLVCLENGRRLRSLKRHLRVAHGLTPEEYRARWGLPADYPMVAPNYARLRRELAHTIGLGRRNDG
jgi:predicted transcriptional regulator/ribosomal protein S18 acetylase RimI-like enzyme